MGDVRCGGVTQRGDVTTRAGWHAVVTWHPLKGRARFARRDEVAAEVESYARRRGSWRERRGDHGQQREGE